MKRLFIALLLVFICGQAEAQQTFKLCVPTTATNCIPITASNPFPVTGSFSTSGFTAATVGSAISVTTGGNTGNLPAGTVVVASNIGTTNTAYCQLGASSSTAAIPISPNGGWFAFTVGASTQLTCITASGSTTVNLVGGAGLPSGTGGGGGGSGGAVTIADGADVALGAKADVAYAGSGDTTTIAALKGIYSILGTSIPAGSNIIGNVRIDQTTPGTTNGVQIAAALPAGTNRVGYITNDPCDGNTAPSKATISISTATTTRIVAPSASNKTYICYILLQTDAANNIAVVEGTGGTCGTGTAAVIGGTTTGTGLHLSANGGLQSGTGRGWVWSTTGTNVDLCLITSAATQLTGTIKYVNLP